MDVSNPPKKEPATKLVPAIKPIGNSIVLFTNKLTDFLLELFCIPRIKKMNNKVFTEIVINNLLNKDIIFLKGILNFVQYKL